MKLSQPPTAHPPARQAVVLIHQHCRPRARKLRFACRRQRLRERLRQAAPLAGVELLDYLIAPNALYLLCAPAPTAALSRLMHTIKSAAKHDLAMADPDAGPVWKGRYATTLIEPGTAVFQAMLCLDLAMCTRAPVLHPAQWAQSGWRELVGLRQRYRLLLPRLAARFVGPTAPDDDSFSDWYIRLTESCLRRRPRPSLPFWEQATAVGTPAWIDRLAETLPEHRRQVLAMPPEALPLSGGPQLQAIRATSAHTRRADVDGFLRKLQRRQRPPA